jgi:hypothetical protein
MSHKLSTKENAMSPMDSYLAAIAGKDDFISVNEKKLTPAELKKREEVAKAMEKQNPDMPMDKKMAIATSVAKKVAEATDKEDLAAAAPPYDKITHKDVLVKRGVLKKQGDKHVLAKEEAEDDECEVCGEDPCVCDGEGEIAEELKGDLHPAAGSILKHIKPEHHSTYKPFLKKGTFNGSYKDRSDVLSAAEKAGHTVSEETELDEDFTKMDTPMLKKWINTRQRNAMGGNLSKQRRDQYDQAQAELKKRKTNEEVEQEVAEAMISWTQFKDKIDMHRKAGNKIVDDKYDDKKASYTVIDKEGVGKKITHTSTGSKQEHLGNVTGDDKKAEVKQTEKRGRGRPAGTKSGARH